MLTGCKIKEKEKLMSDFPVKRLSFIDYLKRAEGKEISEKKEDKLKEEV